MEPQRISKLFETDISEEAKQTSKMKNEIIQINSVDSLNNRLNTNIKRIEKLKKNLKNVFWKHMETENMKERFLKMKLERDGSISML